MSAAPLARRAFLGRLSLGAAAVLGGWLPGAAGTRTLHLTPGGTSLATQAAFPGLGHVDDMWGHLPRYAHPIPHGGSQPVALAWDCVHPIDRMWVAWA